MESGKVSFAYKGNFLSLQMHKGNLRALWTLEKVLKVNRVF